MSLHRWIPAALAVFALAHAGAALAQDDVLEIERDIAELEDLVSDAVAPPGIETALIFSNAAAGPRRVVCYARNAQGTLLGAAAVHVPGQGVRHLLAADVSGGVAFAGQVRCSTRWPVVASGFTASGPRLTDLPVGTERRRTTVTFRFPIVATR